MQRNNEERSIFKEQLENFETKIILVIQAVKNNSEGKDNTSLFEGFGDVMSAVDHFKEMMKGQYAKLSEFKEIEKSVESLTKFHSDYHTLKRQSDKDNEILIDRVEDNLRSNEKLRNDLEHLKSERLKLLENQLIEKLDYNEFEMTVQNIQNYLEGMNTDASPSRIRRQQSKVDLIDDFAEENMKESLGSVDEFSDENSKNDDNPKSKSSRKIVHAYSKDDVGLVKRDSSPQKSSGRNSPNKSSGRNSPNKSRRMSIANPTVAVTGSTTNIGGGTINFKRRKTIRKAPSFIPKDAARIREFERRVKEIDEKLANVVKTSKNDIIPILEKRLNGIREELETKANILDLKKLIPDITEVGKQSFFTNSSI